MSNQASLGELSNSGNTSSDCSESAVSKVDLGPFSIEIPSEWNVSDFDQHIDLVNGVNYESKHYCDKGEGRIFLTLKAVKKGGGFKKEGIKHYGGPVDEEKVLSPGDLLIANTDLTQDGDVVGYPFQVPEFPEDQREIIPSMDLSILELTTDKFNKTFLQYLFRTDYIHSRLRSFSAGSTVLHLNTDLTENLDLPAPPQSEQQGIASILYNIDQAINKTEEMIDQTQRVKKGLMQDLFREGYYEHDTVEGNHRWEEVPEDWDFVPLNEVAKTNPRHNKPDREIAYIEMDAVNEDVPYPDYIGRRNPQESSGRRFEEKDTLFARITPCTENGKICFVDGIETDLGIASTELAVLSPDQDKILPKFLYHYSRTYKVRDYAISRMRGSTGRQRVPFSVFKNELMIPLPDKEEQKEIVDLLDDLDNRKIKLREEKEQLQRLKKGLMQDLLTGEIRTNEKVEVLDEVIEVEG